MSDLIVLILTGVGAFCFGVAAVRLTAWLTLLLINGGPIRHDAQALVNSIKEDAYSAGYSAASVDFIKMWKDKKKIHFGNIVCKGAAVIRDSCFYSTHGALSVQGSLKAKNHTKGKVSFGGSGIQIDKK